MRTSVLLIVLVVAFAIGLALRLRKRPRITEPSCGQCGYCVTGLEHMTCPECGSDLRVVGILTPGTKPPVSRGMKLLGWSLFTPLVTLMLGSFLMPFVFPQWLSTTRRRVIFSQVPYCNAIITANASGQRLIFGNPGSKTAPAPIEDLFLTLSTARPTMMLDVNRFSKQYRFTNAQNKIVSGTFDAAAIERWLNDNGFTDPRVAERAKEIFDAIEEMSASAGQGITQFASNPMANGIASGSAHPTSIWSRPKVSELTWIAWGILAVLVWLAGAVVIRRKKYDAADTISELPQEVISSS